MLFFRKVWADLFFCRFLIDACGFFKSLGAIRYVVGEYWLRDPAIFWIGGTESKESGGQFRFQGAKVFDSAREKLDQC